MRAASRRAFSRTELIGPPLPEPARKPKPARPPAPTRLPKPAHAPRPVLRPKPVRAPESVRQPKPVRPVRWRYVRRNRCVRLGPGASRDARTPRARPPRDGDEGAQRIRPRCEVPGVAPGLVGRYAPGAEGRVGRVRPVAEAREPHVRHVVDPVRRVLRRPHPGVRPQPRHVVRPHAGGAEHHQVGDGQPVSGQTADHRAVAVAEHGGLGQPVRRQALREPGQPVGPRLCEAAGRRVDADAHRGGVPDPGDDRRPRVAAACRVLAIPTGAPWSATFRSKVPASLSDPGTTTETRCAVRRSPNTSATWPRPRGSKARIHVRGRRANGSGGRPRRPGPGRWRGNAAPAAPRRGSRRRTDAAPPAVAVRRCSTRRRTAPLRRAWRAPDRAARRPASGPPATARCPAAARSAPAAHPPKPSPRSPPPSPGQCERDQSPRVSAHRSLPLRIRTDRCDREEGRKRKGDATSHRGANCGVIPE